MQQATNLQPPVVWSNVTNTVIVAGVTNRVTVEINGLQRCFRLLYGPGTEALPWLAVTRSNGSITLSWSKIEVGWNLEYCADLTNNTNAWTQIPPPYATNATDCYVTEPSPSGTRFYRLHKPWNRNARPVFPVHSPEGNVCPTAPVQTHSPSDILFPESSE